MASCPSCGRGVYQRKTKEAYDEACPAFHAFGAGCWRCDGTGRVTKYRIIECSSPFHKSPPIGHLILAIIGFFIVVALFR